MGKNYLPSAVILVPMTPENPVPTKGHFGADDSGKSGADDAGESPAEHS